MTPRVILHAGRVWRFHSATDRELIFRRDSGQAILIAWRTARKLSQRAAAKTLGIAQGQLSRIESGARSCPPALLKKLSS